MNTPTEKDNQLFIDMIELRKDVEILKQNNSHLHKLEEQLVSSETDRQTIWFEIKHIQDYVKQLQSDTDQLATNLTEISERISNSTYEQNAFKKIVDDIKSELLIFKNELCKFSDQLTENKLKETKTESLIRLLYENYKKEETAIVELTKQLADHDSKILRIEQSYKVIQIIATCVVTLIGIGIAIFEFFK